MGQHEDEIFTGPDHGGKVMSGNGVVRKSGVEDADRRLYELSNMLSELEHREDQGDAQASDQIVIVRQQFNAILSEPQLRTDAQACRAAAATHDDQQLQRKAELLEREITFSSIENDALLLRAKAAVRQKKSSFNLGGVRHALAHAADRSVRRQALEKLARASTATEDTCRDLLLVYNERAQRQGYADYVVAKLTYEGLAEEELHRLFARTHDRLWPRWERALADIAAALDGAVEAHDLLFMLRECCGQSLESFVRGGGRRFLRGILECMGTCLDELPISIEGSDIPSAGACYRVRPGEDVRILLNRRLSGFQEHLYLLHEFGHAVYYCFCPVDSELLIDNHLSREIMADLWPQFLKERDLLTQAAGIPSELIDATIQAQRDRETLSLFLLMRDSMFTLEALRQPNASFAELWRDVSRRWLGVDDTSGAFELFDLLHPLDTKSYVFAQVLSEQVFASLHPGKHSSWPSPETMHHLVERFYRPGNTVDWRHKLGF